MRSLKYIGGVVTLLVLVTVAAISADRHWVGNGTGLGRFWDRTANWSATQGGAGGAGVPTALDNVFLDGGGRTEINVNAVCLSFTQTDAAHTTDFKASTSLTVGSGGFSMTAGTFNCDLSNEVTVAGPWSVTGGTFIAGTGTVVLNGSSSQTVGSIANFYNLTLNNSAGFILGTDVTIANTLTLSSGVAQTGVHTVILPSTATVSRSAGHVFGNLRKNVATGATSTTFEIGGASVYSPVTVAFGNVTTAGNLTAASHDGDHPALAGSAINPVLSANRYWTLTNGGVAFNNYSGTFNFGAGDLDPSTNTGTFIVQRYQAAAWNSTAAGTRTSTSTQATGLTGFGDFAVGNSSVNFTITASASAGGAITPSGAVSVPYGNNQSFSVTPNAGYHIDSVLVDGVNQGAAGTYDFTTVTANHSIAAFFSINTYTITSTASAGGTISPSGAVIVNHGGNQSFSITPNAGYHIDSVVVDGGNEGAITSHDFTNVTANHTIAAYFSLNSYTITATASGGGVISPSGFVSVNHGSNQSFTMTPNAGFHIDSVVVDGVDQGTGGSYDFLNVVANHSITAYFSMNVFTITATATAGGTISPSGAVSVNHGTGQSFTISPDAGYHIDSVVVDGADQGAVTDYNFTNVTANHDIAVYFSVDTYTITATASAGGTITPAGAVSVNHGGSRSFTISPDAGHHLDSVVVDGVDQGPVGSFGFSNVTSAHSISAYFTADSFSITSTASSGGSISPSGVTVVTYGGDQSFSMTADAGHHLDSVVVDGVNQGAVGSYDFTNVTAGHVIKAWFSPDMYTVDASAGPNGAISPSGAVAVAHGADQAFTITPDPGYLVADVYVDTVSVGAVPSYTFTNVTGGHTISATFAIRTFPVTASAGPNGSVTPAGVTLVDYDGSQGYAITPDTGYFIEDVFVDSVSVGPVSSYAFTNVTAAHTIHAVFSIRTFAITATAGPNGSVTPAGVTIVNYGGSQAYSITPDAGYFIADVFADSVSVGAVSSYAFNNVTSDHTLEATFALTEHTITATASAGGSISPSGLVGASDGGSRTFTITPNPGYHIDSVVVDGVSQGTPVTYDFLNITANHTIAAYFSVNQYTITATAGSGGSISPSGSVPVSHGSTQGFTITPNTGYMIADVHVDSVSVGAVSSYNFNNILTNHSIHATFAVQTFTVTAIAGANGSVSPAGATTVTYGDTLTVTVTPDSGFFVIDVLVDGVSVGAVTGYTFANVTADHLLVASFGTNAVPTAPLLASPADGDTIPVGMLGSVDFSWHPSTDADAGDTLRYTLTITGSGVNYTAGPLTDTTVTLDLGSVLLGGDTYLWTVSVTDGEVTVSSPDTFSFSVNPGTAVGETKGVPTVYALGQNYPNPFNPVTSIPFDLPERSSVTLKVYNILGAEVLEVVAGENMSAGSYNRTVDFTSLSSGAYFYRISAVGESGAVFEKVMKMVVLK
jgi:hypothetical protein